MQNQNHEGLKGLVLVAELCQITHFYSFLMQVQEDNACLGTQTHSKQVSLQQCGVVHQKKKKK